MKLLSTQSDFYKSVLTILSGSTLAQLIPLATEPLLVRLFTPLEFGILALFLSVATIFSSVATARYEMAIVLPKTDQSAINILFLALLISVFMSLFSAAIVWFFGASISTWVHTPELIDFLFWVPLFVLIAGVFQSFNLWATRKKYFRNMAVSKVSQSSSNAAVSLGSGWMGANALGLISGQMTGWFVAGIPLFYKFWKRDRKLISQVSIPQIKEEAKTHSDFPKVNSLHVLSDMGQQSLFSFIIARLFSGSILGFYSRMIRIVKVPAGFIGGAVGQVFYQKASELWQKDQNIRPLFVSQLKMMLALGLPIFGVLALWGPEIFGFVLTEEWAIAGLYAQILSPWLFFNFAISPFTHIPLIAGKQKRFFLLSLSLNIGVLLALIGGYFINQEIETALYLVSTLQVAFHLFLMIWFYRISKENRE
jgi:O-antigen/teichoic acid export membrane protein